MAAANTSDIYETEHHSVDTKSQIDQVNLHKGEEII